MNFAYLFGLLTLPAVATVIWLAVLGASVARRWWAESRPQLITDADVERRAFLASRLMVARRFFWVRMPGGQVVVYRSTAPRSGPASEAIWRIDRALRVATREAIDKEC